MKNTLKVLLVLICACSLVWLGFRLGRVGWNAQENGESHAPAPPSGKAGQEGPKPPCSDEYVVKRFHKLWYDNPSTGPTITYMGIATEQNPMDAWVIQELLYVTRPDFVVECGAFKGGSAAVWATYLKEANPKGRVLSIDIEDRMQAARQLAIVKERVEFLIGSSTAPEIVAEVKKRVEGKHVLVILDSLHTKEHVQRELELYAPLVQKGDYLVVQDTNLNGNPVRADFGPGPNEAVQEFLAQNGAFQRDRSCERLMFTFCPGGWLRRMR
jgi:cephalosporin hydroxylase